MRFSKALLEKFGSIVSKRTNENFTKRLKPSSFNLISFLLDHKNYKSRVNLKLWIKQQVDTPGIADQLIIDNGWDRVSDDDELIIKILRWVKLNFKYVSDSIIWNTPEHWNTFDESYEKMMGDCEDGALMILILARKCGISENKIKLFCSKVVGGGHACILFTDFYGAEVCIDWCYWYNNLPAWERKEIWNEKNYYYGQEIWFAVNDKKVYINE